MRCTCSSSSFSPSFLLPPPLLLDAEYTVSVALSVSLSPISLSLSLSPSLSHNVCSVFGLDVLSGREEGRAGPAAASAGRHSANQPPPFCSVLSGLFMSTSSSSASVRPPRPLPLSLARCYWVGNMPATRRRPFFEGGLEEERAGREGGSASEAAAPQPWCHRQKLDTE